MIHFHSDVKTNKTQISAVAKRRVVSYNTIMGTKNYDSEGRTEKLARLRSATDQAVKKERNLRLIFFISPALTIGLSVLNPEYGMATCGAGAGLWVVAVLALDRAIDDTQKKLNEWNRYNNELDTVIGRAYRRRHINFQSGEPNQDEVRKN